MVFITVKLMQIIISSVWDLQIPLNALKPNIKFAIVAVICRNDVRMMMVSGPAIISGDLRSLIHCLRSNLTESEIKYYDKSFTRSPYSISEAII